jgi:hypothetical protein
VEINILRVLIPNITCPAGLTTAFVLHKHSAAEIHGSSHFDFPTPRWLHLHRCAPEPVFDLLRWGGTGPEESPRAECNLPVPSSTREYVAAIRQLCIADNIEYVFPVTDFDVWAFSDDSGSQPRALVVSRAAFAALCDKYALAKEAKFSGLSVPSTLLLTGATELTGRGGPDSRWRTKARFGTGSSFQKVLRADELELVKQISALTSIPTIVQPELRITRHVSLNCVACRGRIALMFQLEKTSHLNPSLSTAIRVVDELPSALVSAATVLTERHQLSGFLAMQFIADCNHNWYLIDVNLRLGNNVRIFGPYFPEIFFSIFDAFDVVIPVREPQRLRDLNTMSRDLQRFAAVALADEIVAAFTTRRLPYLKPRYLAHPRDLFSRLFLSHPRAASWHLRSMAKAANAE